MNRHKLGVWIFITVWVLFMELSSLAFAQELSREKIIEGAKKEGKVMYYFSGTMTEQQAVVDSFKKKYPFIDVSLWEAPHSTIYERLRTEKAAGRVRGDFLEFTNSLYFIHLKDAEMLLYYLSPEDKHYRHLLDVKRYPRGVGELRYDPGYWTPTHVAFPAIAYRTDRWFKEDVPKSWRDLRDPKYKGKIVAGDPRFAEEAKLYFYGLKEQLGIDYLKELAKNDLMLLPKGRVVLTKLVTGERSIAILETDKIMEVVHDNKAPVDFSLPEEGTNTRNGKNVAILKDAPHPNCARLLLDHRLSKEVVELFRNMAYNNGVRDDFVPQKNKATLETVKKIWPHDPEKFKKEVPEFLREFVRIFGL